MQLVVGSYTLEGFIPTYDRAIIRSDRGYAQRLRVTMSVEGALTATSSSAMTAAIEALLSSVSSDYQDVIVRDDDGADTNFKLINNDSIDGVKLITPPTFPNLKTIYSLKVPYRIVWQADFSVDDATNGVGVPNVIDFSESVSWQGNGGALKGIQLTPRGEPIEFTLAERTPYFATQSGSITMRGPISRIPNPIWPDKLINPGSSRTQSSPNVRNGVVESYSAQWSYQFQSLTPLIGEPTSIL